MSVGPEHWLAPAAAFLTACGVPSLAIWLLKRGAADAQLVDSLRQALDKGRVRENAYYSALDALITGIDHLQDPPPALLAARARALARMEMAQSLIVGGGK